MCIYSRDPGVFSPFLHIILHNHTSTKLVCLASRTVTTACTSSINFCFSSSSNCMYHLANRVFPARFWIRMKRICRHNQGWPIYSTQRSNEPRHMTVRWSANQIHVGVPKCTKTHVLYNPSHYSRQCCHTSDNFGKLQLDSLPLQLMSQLNQLTSLQVLDELAKTFLIS